MLKKYRKLIYSLVFLLAFILFTYIIKKYFKPFFVIVIILVMSLPLYKILSRKKLFNNKINAAISVITVNVIIFFVLFLIGNFFINKILFYLYNNVNILNIDNILNNLSKIFKIDLGNIGDKLKTYYNNLLNSEFLTKGAVYTTDGLLAYFIGNIAAYFILADRDIIIKPVLNHLPKNKLYIFESKIELIKKIVTIELILVLITTLVTILGFVLLRIKNALLLGIICGILDLLPYVGTILIFIPLILYKISCKQYIVAFGLLFLYILLQVQRQILEAKYLGKNIGIHPLLIILSLYVGMKLFGVIGIFMGPLYIILTKELIINDELRLIDV